MACASGVALALTSNCTTQGVAGFEVLGYVWNRNDMTLTFDGTSGNKITGITAVGSAKIFPITGVKKLFNAGHDVVSADNAADRYKHIVTIEQFARDFASILDVDNWQDLVFCFEGITKGTGGDGTYFIYGAKYGLWRSGDTRRANDNFNNRQLEFSSMDGREEPYSSYVLLITDYAGTKAALAALD